MGISLPTPVFLRRKKITQVPLSERKKRLQVQEEVPIPIFVISDEDQEYIPAASSAEEELPLQEIQDTVPYVPKALSKEDKAYIHNIRLIRYQKYLDSRCTDEELEESDGGDSNEDMTGPEDFMEDSGSDVDMGDRRRNSSTIT